MSINNRLELNLSSFDTALVIFYVTKCVDFPYGNIGTFVFLVFLCKYSLKSYLTLFKHLLCKAPATCREFYAYSTAV